MNMHRNEKDKPSNGVTSEVTLNKEQIDAFSLVLNSVNQRVDYIINATRTLGREFNQRIADKRRNYEKECGYPEIRTLDADFYQNLYNTDPIAARVIEVWPKECWQTNPEIYEDESEEVETAFEKSVKDLCDGLDGDNYHKEKQGSVLWEALQRLDIQCGIGRYGVLFIGLDDGIDPRFPVKGWKQLDSNPNYGDPNETAYPPYSRLDYSYSPDSYPNIKSGRDTTPVNKDSNDNTTANPNMDSDTYTPKRKITFLQVYPESCAKIVKWETDRNHPRYNQPVQYQLTTNIDGSENIEGSSSSGITVHWSRILHVADNITSNKVMGIPRCQQVLHRILDLRNKLYGGSAEMYWLGALPAIIFKTDPSLGGDVDLNLSLLKEQIERLMHGLQRYASLNGMDAQSLAPTVVDPSPQIERHIEAICIKIEMAVRIFKGSERGELSSNQDSVQHSRKIRGRNNRFTIPSIVAAFFNRVIQLEAVAKPGEGYKIFWPDPDSQSPQEKASVALALIETIAKYIQGQVGTIVPPIYLLTSILGGFFTKDEAETILKEGEKYAQEQQKKREEEAQVQMGMEVEKQKAMNPQDIMNTGQTRDRPENTQANIAKGDKKTARRE